MFSLFAIAVSSGIQNPGSVCDGFSDKAVQASGKISFVLFEMSFMVTDLKHPKNQIQCILNFEFDHIHFISFNFWSSKL